MFGDVGVQLEMERALLEGEQQIQLEQLETAKEKVASLEAKESRLLSEAAAERTKVSCSVFMINAYVLMCDRRHVTVNIKLF